MNKRFISLLTLLCLTASLLLSGAALAEPAPLDYAAQLTLNMNSETVKQEVTVRTFIDGDTVHFNVPETVMETGVLKARFLAINTPESTGKIEEYGKAASSFTKEKLMTAESIIVESDTEKWNPDSTGGRYLVWVWYRPEGESEYRNLNIEILQNGLAIANSTANNRYGSIASAALQQAKDFKMHVHSGKKDPDFYYGDAVELTLRELRTNLEMYNGVKVAFSGIITMNDNNGVYIESFDAETGLYYGMSVYYGFGLSGKGLDILSVGNEARIVGTLQYYEAGGTWQVSGLTYRMMKPDDPGNIQKISEGHSPAYVLTDADTFANGSVLFEDGQSATEIRYAELAMATSIEMKNLTVVSAYTTQDEASSSYGAITLTCEADGQTILIRTIPLYDDSGKLIEESAYLGKTVDVRGIVDYYDGDYQIKVFTKNSIVIH